MLFCRLQLPSAGGKWSFAGCISSPPAVGALLPPAERFRRPDLANGRLQTPTSGRRRSIAGCRKPFSAGSGNLQAAGRFRPPADGQCSQQMTDFHRAGEAFLPVASPNCGDGFTRSARRRPCPCGGASVKRPITMNDARFTEARLHVTAEGQRFVA